MRAPAVALFAAIPIVCVAFAPGCGVTAETGRGDAGSGAGATTGGGAEVASSSSSVANGAGGAGGAGGQATSSMSAAGQGGAGGAQVASSSAGQGGAGGASMCECDEPPECQGPGCNGDVCAYVDLAIGTVCGAGVCDGQGQCVECLVGADCASLVCSNNVCLAPSCFDAVLNGSETDVDCGGADCAPCADGGPCVSQADCVSLVCVAGLCIAPTCADTVQNGMETDVDCGGPACPACSAGQGCQSAADCLVGFCMAGVCAAPSCMDAVKNGTETDVDCGGPACPDCAVGQGCQSGADCQSAVCVAGVCAAPSCMDAVKNGTETDVDCGGGACPACIDGETCAVASDCVSSNCAMGVCAPSGPACLGQAPDPLTGQGCPIFTPCTQFSDCGVFQGCNQWFCNNAQCELNTLSNCGTTVGGACAAEVVIQQHDDPPTDKRFVPPDGVSFRELGTLTFTITNNTPNDLYLDKIPMALETMGGGSAFEVTSAKLYDDSGGADFSIGDLFTCLTANPFSFPASGVLGPCAGSSFTKISKNGGSNRFLVTLAFGADKTYIAGRSYRAKIVSTTGFAFKVGFNGPAFAGTMCGVPAAGFAGAWVTAQDP